MNLFRSCVLVVSLVTLCSFQFASAELTAHGGCTVGSGSATDPTTRLPLSVVFAHNLKVDLREWKTYNAASYTRPPGGYWPIWYECSTASLVPPALPPGSARVRLSYLDESNISEQYGRFPIRVPETCQLSSANRNQTRFFGLAECKTLKDATRPLTYGSFAAAQAEYARICTGAQAQPSDSAECKDAHKKVTDAQPDFKAVCFDYGTVMGGDASAQRARLEKMYQACGLTLATTALGPPLCGPDGVRHIDGHNNCICVDAKKTWDEDERKCVTVTAQQCSDYGRVWSGGVCQLQCKNVAHGLIKFDHTGDEYYRCDACAAPTPSKDAQGYCVARVDETNTPSGCARANGFWHEGPGYCEVCAAGKKPGERGCVDAVGFKPAPTPELPHCSAGTYTGRELCKCNADEEYEGERPNRITCKKKEAPKPRDFTPPKVEPKQGDVCVEEGTGAQGRLAADLKRCLIPVARCSTDCNLTTHECTSGRCVPKQVTQPPPQTPCNPSVSPCGQTPPRSGPTGGQPGGNPGQQNKQDPFSQMMKQMGQKGSGSGMGNQGQAGQQPYQQQQDPNLMQRLMQMFQPQPFSNMFGNNTPASQVTCESFEIDSEETTSGLFRAKKGEPIEVTWSVTGAKRISVDTTPRSTTKYDRDTETSATITPSRTGTLTIRLKIDSNLYTKEPCRAKKVRVK